MYWHSIYGDDPEKRWWLYITNFLETVLYIHEICTYCTVCTVLCIYDLYMSSVLTQILIFNMYMRVRTKMCVLYILLYYVINSYAICIVYGHMYILYIHSLWFGDFLSCKIVFISLKDRYTMSIMIHFML